MSRLRSLTTMATMFAWWPASLPPVKLVPLVAMVVVFNVWMAYVFVHAQEICDKRYGREMADGEPWRPPEDEPLRGATEA